jgi:hypothetical protein
MNSGQTVGSNGFFSGFFVAPSICTECDYPSSYSAARWLGLAEGSLPVPGTYDIALQAYQTTALAGHSAGCRRVGGLVLDQEVVTREDLLTLEALVDAPPFTANQAFLAPALLTVRWGRRLGWQLLGDELLTHGLQELVSVCSGPELTLFGWKRLLQRSFVVKAALEERHQGEATPPQLIAAARRVDVRPEAFTCPHPRASAGEAHLDVGRVANLEDIKRHGSNPHKNPQYGWKWLNGLRMMASKNEDFANLPKKLVTNSVV